MFSRAACTVQAALENILPPVPRIPRSEGAPIVDHSQRMAAKISLAVLAADGFILAGAQALIEKGITQRPSQDIDVFACTAGTPRQPSPHRCRR